MRPGRLVPSLWFAIGLVILAIVAGCGDDPSSVDAAVIDAPLDALPDVAVVDRCTALCSCMAEVCGEILAACLTTCADLSESTRECRIDHWEFARLLSPATHCPHARGTPGAPGIPAACL